MLWSMLLIAGHAVRLDICEQLLSQRWQRLQHLCAIKEAGKEIDYSLWSEEFSFWWCWSSISLHGGCTGGGAGLLESLVVVVVLARAWAACRSRGDDKCLGASCQPTEYAASWRLEYYFELSQIRDGYQLTFTSGWGRVSLEQTTS